MTLPRIQTAADIRARVAETTPRREASTGGRAIAVALEVARGASQDIIDRLDGASRIVVTSAMPKPRAKYGSA